MVPLEAFHAAFATGDVAVIASYFSSEIGSAHILRTEAFLKNVTETDAFQPRFQRDQQLWYANPQTVYQESLLRETIKHGHYDVVKWLFDAPRIALIPTTLRFLIRKMCRVAAHVQDLAIVEYLLTSRVFTELLPNDKRQHLLDELLLDHATHSPEMMELVLAHGANINYRLARVHPLTRCGCLDQLDQLDVLLRNGIFAVGLPTVVHPAYCGKTAAVQRLIASGADVAYDDGKALRYGVRQAHPAVVKVLLEDGFADADTKDGGRAIFWTARLMRGAHHPDSAPGQIKQLLLEYGATVNGGADVESVPNEYE